MSRGRIIIQNRGDGRGMMLPEREGRGTFNKLPFVSMALPKDEIGINPVPPNVIIKTRKLNPNKIRKDKKREVEDRLYPLENYRKIKTSEQFWKKNENPMYKEYNKNAENKNNKTVLKEINNYINKDDIKKQTITNNLKAPKKLNPIINKSTLNKNNLIEDRKNNEDVYEVKPETKEVRVTKDINYRPQSEKKNDINNGINLNNNDIPERKEKNEEYKNEKEEEYKDTNDKEDKKDDKKDPLLDDLDENENIDDVINYLNGLDYDKYCKDMEIREALSLLKNKMDKELEEKKIEEEKNKNKVIIEGAPEEGNEEKKDEDEEEKDKNEEDIEKKENNKLVLPEINKKLPEQNPVEIVDEEELKRQEEIKKYKIAEQIAKTDQMKAVHSVNSIKKLLQREGLDKIEPAPLKITVIKESPLANCDGYEANKLPFLHSLPLV